MKLHLGGLRNYAQSTIFVEHANPTGLNYWSSKKEERTQPGNVRDHISLSYAKFGDIKGCDSAKKMWDALHSIYGGDKNVLRAKSKTLRGKFNDMRMQEGENIAQYCLRIKDVVNAIRGAIGTIDDDTILIKVLRTLLPIYAIRVSAVQEMRCIPGNTLSLKDLVGRLTAFELSNFDNYKLESLEFSFKAKLSFISIAMKLVILLLDV